MSNDDDTRPPKPTPPPVDPHENWSARDYLVAIYLQTKSVGIDVIPGKPTDRPSGGIAE